MIIKCEIAFCKLSKVGVPPKTGSAYTVEAGLVNVIKKIKKEMALEIKKLKKTQKKLEKLTQEWERKC